MKRPLAVLGTIVLAGVIGISPAVTATADVGPTPSSTVTDSAATTSPATPAPAPTRPHFDPPALLPDPHRPKATARWVNGTLTVEYSAAGAFHEGTSDTDTQLQVDGTVVGSLLDRGLDSDVVTLRRAASAGPARVEVVAVDLVERGSYYDTYPTVVYAKTVSRQVVRAKKGQVSAVALLGKLRVAEERHAGSYERSKFKLWLDADHDGENTRAEVLKTETTKRVTENSSHTVKTGRWVSPYDGKAVASASKLDIDHLVPLEEAWTSGASSWSAKRRSAYANDLGYAASLVAVTLHENRSKGDEEPNAYLPPKTSYVCAYVRNWIAVKYRWALKVDSAEKAALKTDLAADCTNPNVTKPGKPDITKLVGVKKASGGSSSGGSGSGGGGSTTGLDPRYATCTELLKHPNHAPYKRGVDAEYAWYQDRDGDGLVCE